MLNTNPLIRAEPGTSWPPPNRPGLIAHRLGASLGPENTIEALNKVSHIDFLL